MLASSNGVRYPRGGAHGPDQGFRGRRTRPFLLLPPTLVASGAAAAAWDGHFSWLHTVLALVGLVVLHMAVNILNEWSDMRTGIDLETERTPFSGGSGTLPAGGMSSRTALGFGLVSSAVGLGIGLWFIPRIGTYLVPIMVLGFEIDPGAHVGPFVEDVDRHVQHHQTHKGQHGVKPREVAVPSCGRRATRHQSRWQQEKRVRVRRPRNP